MTSNQRNKVKNIVKNLVFESGEMKQDPELQIKCEAVYVSFVNDKRELVLQEGIRQSGIELIPSLDIVCKKIVSSKIPKESLANCTTYVSVVNGSIILDDPVKWNKQRDGIFFMWGDRYQALYLPFEMTILDMDNARILDRLCSYKAGIFSSAWRYPEGLVWALDVEEF